jgi:hypothetical protein
MRISPETHARFTRGWVTIPGSLAIVAAIAIHWFVTPLITLRMPLVGQIVIVFVGIAIAGWVLMIGDALVSEIIRQIVPATCPLCGGRMYYVPHFDPSVAAGEKPVQYRCRDCGGGGELKLRYRDVNPQLEPRSPGDI